MITDNEGRPLYTAQIAAKIHRRRMLAAWGRYAAILIVLYTVASLLLPEAEAAELEVYTSHSWQEEHAARRPGMTYWPDGIVLEYPAGWQQMAELAAWRWSQRIGKTITVRAATSEGSPRSGVMTIAPKTAGQIFEITQNVWAKAATQRWSWMDTGHIAGAIIYVPVGAPCLEHTLLHEVGHAIGIATHDGTQPTDVMHASQSSCLPALTPQDVSMAPYTDHPCHAELMPDGGLFVPAIAGKSGYLKRMGDLWRLERVTDTSLTCAEAQAVNGMGIRLSDVRSPDGRWMGELEHVGGENWRILWVSDY